MSTQHTVMGRLSAAQYQRMCCEVCGSYCPQVTAEALLFALCKRVFHHLYGYRQDLVLPYSEEPRPQVYKSALQRMVSTAQSEPFDALEVAGHYLKGI